MKTFKNSIKKWLLSRKQKQAFVNFELLANEVKEDLSYDERQIQCWADRYLKEKNPLTHPYIEIAQVYTNGGLHERASDFYLRYLAEKDDQIVHSLYLQNLLLSPTTTNATLLEAHQAWEKKFIPRSIKQIKHQPKRKTAGEKLKIGYIGHFFTNSVSQNCLLPLLKAHDRQKFEIFCYDDGIPPTHPNLYSDHWRDIKGLPDKAVAKMIHRDGVDILQELNGFCFLHRFGALAYKPAPIQINWYNHTSTTGLPFIDYVMSDVISIPDQDLPFFIEEAYRHSHFIAAVEYDEKKFRHAEKQTPANKNGYITFCYFGSTHKITLPAIALWSRVLKSLPHAKLMLKSGSFSHDLYRKLFLKHFSQQGIAPHQLILNGWSDQTQTIQQYNEVDIMLDNIPVNGGSTLFEALLQGVPVVSMLGHRWAARSGPSVLTTLGHPELIAKTEDEYVDIAVNLANDIARLNNYRCHLQHDMLHSSLTNIQQYYQNFESAYHWMWQRWCA